MTINYNVSFTFGSCDGDLLQFLVLAENPNAKLAAVFEGTSIAIGYRYDLLLHSQAQNRIALSSVGITLTASQEVLLNEARAGDVTVRRSVPGTSQLRRSETCRI